MLLSRLKIFSQNGTHRSVVFPIIPFILLGLIFALPGRALANDARQPEQASFSGFDTPPSAESAKRVLAYLQDMVDRCKRAHRPDLTQLYGEAWEIAADKIYGKIPPYQNKGCYVEKPKPATIPAWQIEFKARPLRRIVRRSYRSQHGASIEYEHLECGHVLPAPYGEEQKAKRRRCLACAREILRKKPDAVSALPLESVEGGQVSGGGTSLKAVTPVLSKKTGAA